MEEKKTCPCCEERHKERSDKEYKDLIHRLNRMEGQIRGIRGMVERGVYCTDILVQVAAVNAALNSFNRVLLANHIKTCVTDDIRAGKEETGMAVDRSRRSSADPGSDLGRCTDRGQPQKKEG